MVKIVTEEHLDEATIAGYVTSKEPNPKIGVRVSTASGNILQRTPEGLYVPEDSPTKYYLIKRDVIEISGGAVAERRSMSVYGKLFVIYLSFKARTAGRHIIFELPSEAPSPLAMVGVSIGAKGLVWIEAGGREVICNGLPTTQVSLQLIGFTA